MFLISRSPGRVVLALAFGLVCSVLSEPSEDYAPLPTRIGLPKIVRSPRVPHRVVPAPVPSVVMNLPANKLTPLPLSWPTVSGGGVRTADLVRQEIGDRITADEFSGPGIDPTLASWMGSSSWMLPSWFHSSVKSYSTQNGQVVDVDLFFHWEDWKVFVGIRNESTGSGFAINGYYPGFTVEVYEYPVQFADETLLISPKVSLWSQPLARIDGLATLGWGALGSLTVEIPLADNFWFWVEGQGKTPGWSADSLALGNDLGFRTGIHWAL